MTLFAKEKRTQGRAVASKVYGRNTTHNLLNQRFSRLVLADFCATLRESNGNAGKNVYRIGVVPEAQS